MTKNLNFMLGLHGDILEIRVENIAEVHCSPVITRVCGVGI
jgi:hypothetical protein